MSVPWQGRKVNFNSIFFYSVLFMSKIWEREQNENESLFICVFDVTALYSNEMKFMLNHLGVCFVFDFLFCDTWDEVEGAFVDFKMENFFMRNKILWKIIFFEGNWILLYYFFCWGFKVYLEAIFFGVQMSDSYGLYWWLFKGAI